MRVLQMNFQKQLNNRKPLPEPPTVGTIDQLLISDGQDGTKWSTSLLGQEAACLSAYVSANFVLAITGLPGLQLQSPPVALGLDFSATSTRAFSIFNPFTGANNTTQRIFVSVNYSINLTGNNNGDFGAWVQIINSANVVQPARYGYQLQKADSQGNSLCGSTVIGLGVGERATFFVMNTSNGPTTMIGGNINTVSNVTKFQSALIN